MAKSLTSGKAMIQVEIGGVDQAKKHLDALRDAFKRATAEADKLKDDILKADNNRFDSTTGQLKTGDALKEANKELAKAEKAYNKRMKDAQALGNEIHETTIAIGVVEKNLGDISGHTKRSLVEMKKILEATIHDMEHAGQFDQVKRYQEYVNQLSDAIKRLTGANKEYSDYMSQLDTVSGTTLSGLKKRLEDLVAGTDKNTAELKEYEEQLRIVTAEEERRATLSAKAAADSAIAQTKTMGLDEEDPNRWRGSLEDLEKMRKALEAYKREVNFRDDPKGLEAINEAIIAIDKETANAARSMADLHEFVNKRMKSASLNELKQAAEELQKRLNAATRNTEDYVDANEDLKKVNAEIKRVNDSWKEHDGTVKSVAKRLVAYVAVYGGFNEVKDIISGIVQGNIELSDSLADIEKTTGLSAESVAELSREIDKIDTRTAQQELHELAYEAGKLGIKGEEDVLGFVKAGNQLIAALGEDLGGGEAVRTLMKINDLLGETANLGVEKALLSTGSAINELTMNSTASAEPMVDVVSRLGAIGNQAGLTMADLIALGSTVDSLSLHAEMSGTAITKFLGSMMTNSHAIEYALQIEPDTLKNLMDSGHAMEAMVMVLERVKGMDDAEQLNIFKTLGSEGSRMVTVFSSLAKNVDTLKEHVDISNRAFAEATSVTEEYNIKNNNLAAIVERIKNTFRELVTNSRFVEFLTNIAESLKNVVDWLTKSEDAWKTLQVIMVGVAAVITKNLIVAITGLRKVTNTFSRAYQAHMTANAGVTARFVAALKGLKAVFMTNIWTIAVVAIAELANYLLFMRETTDDLTRATDEMNEKLEEEELIMRALFGGAKNENATKETKKELIEKINERYGKYLGFMLDEKASVDQLAAAYDLVNAKMRERESLLLKTKMEEQVAGEYAGQFRGATKGMKSVFDSSEGISSELSLDAIDIVKEVVDKNIGLDNKAILNAVQTALSERFSGTITNKISTAYGELQTQSTQGETAFKKAEEYITNYINSLKQYNSELETTRHFVGVIVEKSLADQEKANNDLMKTFNQDFVAAQTEKVDESSAIAMREHNERVRTALENYLTTAKNQMALYLRKEQEILRERTEEEARLKSENLTEQEKLNLQEANKRNEIERKKQEQDIAAAKAELRKNIDVRTQIAEELNSAMLKPGVNIWGTNKEYVLKSAQDLKDYYNMVKKTHAEIREDADFTKVYGGLYKNAEEAKKVFYDEMVKTRDRLKNEFGVNMSLDPLTPKGKGKSRDKKTREEVAAAMSALEAYYKNRKGVIQDAFLDEKITTQEMERQITELEAEQLGDRIELRKKLLGKENTFDQSKYGEYFAGKDLDTTAKFVKQIGDTLEDGILNQLEGDENAIRTKLIERMQRMFDIVTKHDYQGKVDWNYQKELEDLDLFWANAVGTTEQRSQEMADARIAAMKELAKKSYDLNADGLKKEMDGNKSFSQWTVKRKDLEYQTLLEMLRQYYDDVEEAENRERQRKRRIAEGKWERTRREEYWSDVEKDDEQDVKLLSNLRSIGLASDSMVEDEEITLYRNRLAAAQEYYNLMKKEGADMTQAEQRRSEALQALSEKEMEIQQRKMETLKGYTDAVVDFGAQMGEAAFGEVEDRKAAAKQLLQTTMQLTKDLIMEKVKELIMKQTLGKQEIAMEQAQQATETAMHGQQVITDLTVEGASTTAKTAMGISGGAAKTIGELGWWGIPLIAVISAALSALMGAAMGALNKSKSEVAAATGVSNKGRVAAGMLTYAEGKYPVLGADGETYNARYEPKLKTGVYRGGAHFGIFSEKQPEMVVDGPTTQKIMLNYPAIYDSIMTISKHGKLRAVMPAYADGRYPQELAQAMAQANGQAGAQPAADTAQMQQTLERNTAVMQALLTRLNQPINATVDPYGKGGAVNQLSKSEAWMRKKGLIK